MRKFVKTPVGLLALSASMFVASPAYAWYETAFFDENGDYVGGELRCDNGVLLRSWGQSTSNFVNTYGGYLPYYC